MSYKVNNIEFLIQPTTGRWLPRYPVDIAGNGHPVYGAERQYELRWNLVDPSLVDQLRDWFATTVLTGTVSVDLPCWTTGAYAFQTYTDCVLYEPEQGVYFNEDITDIVMIVGNLR